MVWSWIKYSIGAVIVVTGLLFYKHWTPDISHSELAAKYATGASDFIELPSGAKAHYRIQGNDKGPTVVLLHGSNASLHTWEGWVEALEDQYFVVTVDLPGHGLTGATPDGNYTYDGMMAFLEEFTKTIGLKRFSLGGNSMGGAVTLKYALTYPQKLDGLILVDSAGIDTPINANDKVHLPLAFQLAGHWYSSWLVQYITPRSLAGEGLITAVADPKTLNSAMIDRYWELARHPGNRNATNMRFTWYREGRTALPVENIKIPTLILWGQEDRLIPVETAHELSKRITGSTLTIFENLGHIPMEEDPKETIKPVKEFLADLHSQRNNSVSR